MKLVPIYNILNRVVANAIVDDEDYERLMHYRWTLSPTRDSDVEYVKTNVNQRTIRMHRLILNLATYDYSTQVDHRDLDGLNNQKSNLRVCTPSQNGSNKRKYRYGSSQYKGVSWYAPLRKWCARISVNSRTHSLGYYKDEVEAARAYDRAALRLCGEFARVNFPDEVASQ